MSGDGAYCQVMEIKSAAGAQCQMMELTVWWWSSMSADGALIQRMQVMVIWWSSSDQITWFWSPPLELILCLPGLVFLNIFIKKWEFEQKLSSFFFFGIFYTKGICQKQHEGGCSIRCYLQLHMCTSHFLDHPSTASPFFSAYTSTPPFGLLLFCCLFKCNLWTHMSGQFAY